MRSEVEEGENVQSEGIGEVVNERDPEVGSGGTPIGLLVVARREDDHGDQGKNRFQEDEL